MRAVLSEAFVAGHRISPWRVTAVVAVIAAALMIPFGIIVWSLPTPNARTPVVAGLLLVTGLIFFLGMLAVIGTVWWLLWRLRWRGWAASILAGGLLVVAVELGAWAAMKAFAGAHVPLGAKPTPIWLLALYSASLGFGLGWIIWRVAYRPAELTAMETVMPPE